MPKTIVTYNETQKKGNEEKFMLQNNIVPSFLDAKNLAMGC